MRRKIQFSDTSYSFHEFQPNILFYRFLAPAPEITHFPKSERIKLWIPNTIVYDGLSSPFWIFTSTEGYVYRINNFSDTQALERLGSSSKHDLVAISRTLVSENDKQRTNIQLLNNNGLAEKLRTMGCNKDRIAVQKFIKCKGKKSFVCRTVWTREKPSFCFLITNNVFFRFRYL